MAEQRRVDPEDFQAWKDSQLTQWVLSRLLDLREQKVADKKAALFHSAAALDPSQWASQQPDAAFVQGQCDAFDFVANVTLDQLQEEEEPKT